jgi:hypothetical protein
MAIIEGATARVQTFAGTPGAGTSAVQTITIGGAPTASPGVSTFTLAFEGYQTAPIDWNATNATLVSNIDTALEALGSIGTGGVTTAVGTMTAGVGTITVTFAGNRASQPVSTITVVANNMTGAAPTIAVATTTPGVNSDFRGAGKGQVVSDTTNGLLYINTGTANVPIWTKVGTQT